MTSDIRPLRRHADLRRLLDPASIAVIGASPREGAFGDRVVKNLAGYDGRIHLVNARYERIGERPCYPSIAAVPEPVDCAVLVVGREAVEPIIAECAASRAGGAVVFASGYAETGKPERLAEQQRLAAIARDSAMPIIGPNCIGIVNAARQAAVTFMDITPVPPPRPRAIGLISQSGALGMALAQAVVRGVSFSHVLTSGNCCDVDMADYVAYLAEDPACSVIACVFEGMAAPARLIEAAELAWRADKPLIVYKMATGEEGAAAAMSHTGSLAGSHAAYRAAFRRAGAIVVDDYEAVIETAAYFAKAPPPAALGVAVIATSGGAAIMAADRAGQHGVPLPQPNAAVRAILQAHIPDFGAARNPCDVTAQVINDPNSLTACVEALLAAPEYGAVVMPQIYAYEPAVKRLAVLDALAAKHHKVVCNVWQTEWREGPGTYEAETARHIARFHSMNGCFATLAAAYARAERRRHPPAPVQRLAPVEARDRAAALLDGAAGRGPTDRVLSEREAKAVLALYGIPVAGEHLAASAAAAIAAAETLGYPVVLKAESPDLPHKTEAGVIHLDLRDAAAVRAAYDAIVARVAMLEPRPRLNGVLVQQMVPAGLEIVVGGRVDPLFGPQIVVGLGGALVELLADTALAAAPLAADEAKVLLGDLRGYRLLHGFRGGPATDLDRLAEIVCRAGEFVADQRERIAELDINPLICRGAAIVAVDALIVRAAAPL